jgi:hypothetical protein
MATVENATFACAASEAHLVALRMPGNPGHAGQQQQPPKAMSFAQLPASAPAACAVLAPACAVMRSDSSGAASQSLSASAPGCVGSPGKGRLSGMRDGQAGGSSAAALGKPAAVCLSSCADGSGIICRYDHNPM